MSKNIGKVSQVIGPVVDVMFENNETVLPNIYDSLEITRTNGDKLILESTKISSKRGIWKFECKASVEDEFVCSATILCADRPK